MAAYGSGMLAQGVVVMAILSIYTLFSAGFCNGQDIAHYLIPHNEERQRTGVPDLLWDDGVASYSRWWANHQRNFENCAMRHSNGPYGENLFWGSGKAWTPGDAVSSWVDEKQHYSYSANACAGMCGHYTQVVWRNTRKLGCTSVTCDNGNTLIICNYDPPGNYIGQRPF
ncbi:hypothetical protein O6H91_17G056800 [Diphasiastrum complanatum]|uniref:Uncharacterized protein n=1 Tax=Diphasiastrum complanatum TaxID=34168 RepID=A0ACC2B721_DIPCM|nr:hypothetical protein O6H91_17G056800 [Diphasiastrum complanatum]